MQAKAQKWGNSLAVRIPKTIAEGCGISVDSPLEISREGNAVVITPVKAKPSLDELLNQITEENLHAEISTGKAVGKEVW